MRWIEWMILLSVVLGGCSAPEKPIDYVATISNLEGSIETNKDQYVTGEPIEVKVFLKNVSTQDFQAEVAYRREDPNAPIQSVSFNAIHREDRSLYLQPVEFPLPFQGVMKIKPKEQVEFMKMQMKAPENGEYLISCNIEWKINRNIPMTEKIISVRHPDLRRIRSVQEIPENLRKQIVRHIFELKSSDSEEKDKAIKALLEGGGPSRFMLVQSLGSEDAQLAQLCLFLLLEMKQEAKEDLLIGMNSTQEEVRWKCCFALEKLGEASVIPELIKFLDVETANRNRIRMVSLYLNLIEEPIAQWALIQAMKNEDRVIRKMAHKRMILKQKELEFDPSASLKTRSQQIVAWEEWWKSAYPNVKVPAYNIETSEDSAPEDQK